MACFVRWSFYYYSGVRPTDQESATIEKEECHSQFPRGGATQGSSGVSQEAERAAGKRGQEPFLWFPGKAKRRKAGRVSLGLAGLNNSSGLWGLGGCL